MKWIIIIIIRRNINDLNMNWILIMIIINVINNKLLFFIFLYLLTSPSWLAEARIVPEGLNLIEYTSPVCPVNLKSGAGNDDNLSY